MPKPEVSFLLGLVTFFGLVSFSLCDSQKNTTLRFNSPKLVVFVIIDGLPQTQISRYADQFVEGGFRLLREEGAWFSNAYCGQSATFTAVGHASIVSGTYAFRHGLIGNEWMDRVTKKRVYSVEDARHSYLEEPTPEFAGTSPEKLKVVTMGDQLRLETDFHSRVLCVSGKDRSAILTAGKSGSAYFFSANTGRFITSTYYAEHYPQWWKNFYSTKPQNQWFFHKWKRLFPEQAYLRSAPDDRPQHVDQFGLGTKFPHLINGGSKNPDSNYYAALIRTPFGDDYTLQFIRSAVLGEQLGKIGNAPDILVAALSSHDYINHIFGPESKQSQDHLLRLDSALEEFFGFLKNYLGLENILIVLTSDHGFSYSPEHCIENGLEGGRLNPERLLQGLNKFLVARFGKGQYVLSWFNPTIYLNYEFIDEIGLNRFEVEDFAVDFLLDYPGVEVAFNRKQFEDGELPSTELGRQVLRSWHPMRSGDIFVIQKNCWYLLNEPNELAATHGSPHEYDTNVPVLFLGPWFKSGQYSTKISVVDIAPTVAHILHLQLPSPRDGRILTEILK